MTFDLRVDEVSKRWAQRVVLAGVDLHVHAEEVVAVLGRSGSGKTTLLRIVAGLESPDLGTVRLGGVDVTHAAPGSRNLGVVFQHDSLLPHLSVAENIGFALSTRRHAAAAVREQVDRAARLTSCRDLLSRVPATLSGGERQRVALARALVRRPGLVLLDEPLSSLDVHERAALRTELRAALVGSGSTAVHVTHDQSEAFAIADRVAVLGDGTVQQIGSADELFDRPASVNVAKFVGSPMVNLVDVDGLHDEAEAWGIEVPRHLQGDVLTAGIRPADVDLHVACGGRSAAGPVVAVEVVDEGAVVHVDVDGLRVRAVVDRSRRPRVGDVVAVRADHRRIHLFDRTTGKAVHHPS